MARAPRKSTTKDKEPPARKVISTYDVANNYPRVELVDTDNADIREAWEITERVLVTIDGEEIAADPGDYVYKLKLPGAAEKLEVLQRDVALAMYEVRPDLRLPETFPFPGQSADTPLEGGLSAIAQDLADNAPPEERRQAEADRRHVPGENEAANPDPDLEERRDTLRRSSDVASDLSRIQRIADTDDERDQRVGPADRRILALDGPAPGPGAVALIESTVQFMKRQRKPYRDMTENEQDRVLADLDQIITQRVRELVVDIAARDFPYVHATLEKVEFSDGIKASLSLMKDSEHRHELSDHAKQTVTVVLAGAVSWTSGERPRPDPDQPKLV